MSLYDDALAAGRPQNLSRDTLQQVLAMRDTQEAVSNGYDTGYTQWSDPSKTYDAATDTHGYTLYKQHGWNQEGSGDAMTPRRDMSKDKEYITQVRPGTGGRLGDAWDLEGNYLGTYEAQDGGGKQFNQAALMFGSALGGMYMQGMQGANAGGSALDQAMIDMGAGATNVAPSAAPELSTLAGSSVGEVAATEVAANSGVQTIEIVGSKLPAAVGPGVTAAEVAAPIGGTLTMEQLGNIETTPEVTDPTNYSNEGRNYPTTESTQGSGGSPVNSTSQFPGTPITDVNGNPVTQPTYDSNGNQIVPTNTPGTNTVTPGTNTIPPVNNSTIPPINDWASLFSVLSGLYGLKLANDATEKSDPFGPYREGYAKKLQALEANPGTLRNTPGFFTGQDMINRSMASKGYLGSGNQAAALQRFGGDFYHQEANRLAGLAGANINPGNTYFNAADLAGRSLSNIGYGLSPYMQPRGPR